MAVSILHLFNIIEIRIIGPIIPHTTLHRIKNECIREKIRIAPTVAKMVV